MTRATIARRPGCGCRPKRNGSMRRARDRARRATATSTPIAWYNENSGRRDARRGWEAGECLRPVRHAGQRLGVGGRIGTRPYSPGSATDPRGPATWTVPCAARGVLDQRLQGRARVGPFQGRVRRTVATSSVSGVRGIDFPLRFSLFSFVLFSRGGAAARKIFGENVSHGNKAATLRGGSWNNNARNARASNRNRNEPANHNHNIGFRCAGMRALPFREAGRSRRDHGPGGSAPPASGLWSRREAHGGTPNHKPPVPPCGSRKSEAWRNGQRVSCRGHAAV